MNPQRAKVNFTGGLTAVDNAGAGSTDVSLATTVPNNHTFTGAITLTGGVTGTGSNNFDFSGASGNFNTSNGTVNLNGNTVVASGKTVTAGAGTTTGSGSSSAVNVAVASGLTTGSLLNVDTGTSTFGGNAVNFTSSGDFGGTLVKLTADSTVSGTVLGLHTNALKDGAIINADLGASIYTGNSGALRLTANSASTGVLLAISGTTLAANGGTAAQITLGTPGGAAEPAEGKALRVALGLVGDAYYANAGATFGGSFERFQVAGVDVYNATATTITTKQSIVAGVGSTGTFDFSPSSGTFKTSTGLNTLSGDTTVAAGKNLSAAAGAGKFDFSLGTGTFDTTTGAVTLRGDTTVAAGKNFSAAAGAGKLDFSLATGTFDTSTGAVTLRGNTATASGITFTAGSGIVNAVNAVTVTTGLLTTGSAVKIDVGATAPGAAVNSLQGLALDINGTGSFQGLGSNASLAKITSSGAFLGTLTKLSADSTQSGTVLGISAASLTTGKAIDVQLAATYAGGGANTGAVNVRGGAFSGNLLSVSASADAQSVSTNLANFAAPLTQGHILNLAVTGTYAGTGALFVDLTGATGATGTGILVNTASGYTGRFIDLQLAGATKFNVDPTNISTTLNFAQTGVTNFSTGTGTVSLNGATTLASGKSFSSSGGAANFDFSTSTGTFKTSSGAVTINGSTTIVNGKTLTVGTGTALNQIQTDVCTPTGGPQYVCAAAGMPGTIGTNIASLAVTDIILVTNQSTSTGNRACFVAGITAGTNFTVSCTGTLSAGAKFNVILIR